MPFLLSALLAALLPMAFADVAQPWHCLIETTLHGDADYFMQYGRDSWSGRAPMTCQMGTSSQTKSVEITYNGSDLGFGVNANSLVTMHIEILTDTAPVDLQVYSYVYNSNGANPAIIWQNQSGTMFVNVIVNAENVPGIRASLQRGNLYIR
jgi:hypothetical protein